MEAAAWRRNGCRGSVPLIFNPRATSPTQQVANGCARVCLRRRRARGSAYKLRSRRSRPARCGITDGGNNEPHLSHTPAGRLSRRPIQKSPQRLRGAAIHRAIRQSNAYSLATPATAETETEIARTAALKHEPRFAAEAIEKVGLGTRVTVLRKERDWIKVKVNTSGNVGYLRKEYLAAVHSRPLDFQAHRTVSVDSVSTLANRYSAARNPATVPAL